MPASSRPVPPRPFAGDTVAGDTVAPSRRRRYRRRRHCCPVPSPEHFLSAAREFTRSAFAVAAGPGVVLTDEKYSWPFLALACFQCAAKPHLWFRRNSITHGFPQYVANYFAAGGSFVPREDGQNCGTVLAYVARIMFCPGYRLAAEKSRVNGTCEEFPLQMEEMRDFSNCAAYSVPALLSGALGGELTDSMDGPDPCLQHAVAECPRLRGYWQSLWTWIRKRAWWGLRLRFEECSGGGGSARFRSCRPAPG